MNLARAAAAAALLVLPFSLGVTTPAQAAIPAGDGGANGNANARNGGAEWSIKVWFENKNAAAWAHSAVNPDPTDPGYGDFKYYPDCPGNTVDKFTLTVCASAVSACANQPGGLGYQAVLIGQFIKDKTWTVIERTCDPDTTIRRFKGENVLSAMDLATIVKQYPFATPSGTLTPAGGTTLVNLPTYYQMTWGAGSKPNDVQTASFKGHTISLRTKLLWLDYDFGDGEHTGPTQSLGGPYPTGDITHTYTKPGAYTPTVKADWTVDYSLDGGPWQAAQSDTTTIGTFPALTVVTATSRLETDTPGA